MAQEFFRQLLPGNQIFSRGLYADPAYVVPQKVIQALEKHHISFSGHTPAPLTKADLEKADLILCMEQNHEEYLLDHFAQYTNKIWLLTEFAYDKREEIEDPIGLEGRGFEKAAEKLFQACQQAATRIKQDFSSKN